LTPLFPVEGKINPPLWWPEPFPAMDDYCAHPKCWAIAQHRHHAIPRGWQRATFGGMVFECLLIDMVLVRIIVDLCAEHHDQLESGPWGCKARLRWAGGWMWYDRLKGDPHEGQIVYRDSKTGAWVAKGFCKGDYRLL
jgi:hypothetical protein